MDIHIREAELRDIDALREIDLLSFGENRSYDAHIDPNWIYGERAIHYFTHAIQDKNRVVFVAISDGAPVGFISVLPKEVDYRAIPIAEIANLAVIPAYRSKGIGTKLIMTAKEWAKEHQFSTLYVSSYAKNIPAIQLYKVSGFTDLDIGLELDIQ